MRRSDAHIPVVLFGAFDRHNFGDLLFPHITAALLRNRRLIFAGLANRDLRGDGGHRVTALPRLAAPWRDEPVHILHVGGELLTCNAWQAAAMLLPPRDAGPVIDSLDRRPGAAAAWAHDRLGTSAMAPYTVPRAFFPHAAALIYNAVGGVALSELDPATYAEVLANLRAADDVSVRDGETRAQLHAAGIAARLTPDPAVMVAELFGDRIRRRARQGEVGQMRQAFPQGYLAVQFSADFGDEATLAVIAAQLDEIALASGYGIVFFRAGAAPWHDDLRCYERTVAFMRAPARLFVSLNLWDICALIACSRAFAGSSLHGRITAMAFALPRINLVHPAQAGRPSKQEAFAAAWDAAGIPAAVEARDLARGTGRTLSADPEHLRGIARELAERYRRDFEKTRAVLG